MRIAVRRIDGDAAFAGIGRAVRHDPDRRRAPGRCCLRARWRGHGAASLRCGRPAMCRPMTTALSRARWRWFFQRPVPAGPVQPALWRGCRRPGRTGSGRRGREGEGGRSGALCWLSRHCERSEAIHSFFSRRDGLLRFARNDDRGEKRRARPWGTGGSRARSGKRRLGSLLFSADVNAVTSDVELNTNRIRLSVSRITPAIIFSSASVAVLGSVTVLGAWVTTGCTRFSAAT